MKLTLSLAIASLAAGLLLTAPTQAQDARTVTLRFRKAGDTVAIRGALITIDHTIEAGVTDANGIVTVPDLDDGGHIVEAVAKGYQAFFDKFTSGPSVKMPIDLEILAVVAAPKPKGAMTPLTLVGFDARRAKAAGKFYTAAQLKAANGRPLANLLKVTLGAFIASGPNGESYLAVRGNPTCRAAVVRDGLQVYPYESALPPDLDKIFTDDLGGIELYATAPADLKDAGSCGALVLWSR
ncbi:MAG: Plug domain-containing protein [Gemmatimonadaceae bacterium]|nr:Plug domain-containing protein [Gemmatimonadaceae bacterium]